jgi:hypothetical protein
VDDGFSLDLSGAGAGRYAFQYKPDYVSPIAARFAPSIAKPDFVSALDTNQSRRAQGQTAAALAGCGSCGGGLAQFSRRVPYKPSHMSPIAYRMAPGIAQKADFVSALDPHGMRSTRYKQNRTAASLASLDPKSIAFDPNSPSGRALNTARIQIGLEPITTRTRYVSDGSINEDGAVVDEPDEFDEAGNGYEMTITDDSGPPPVETFFRNADGTMKTVPVVGGIAAAGLIAILLFRG